MKNYLIFDFGASNGRAIIAKYNGKRFDLEVMHRFENRPVLANGILYWDFLRLYSELKLGLVVSNKIFKKIESLGIDAWGVDFGFIDKNGHLISNPHHYRNEARQKIAKRVYEDFTPEKLFELTGGQVVKTASLYQLYSLKINKSLEWKNAFKFLMIPDLFNYFLTGMVFNEFTEATTSLFYDQKSKLWSQIILEKLEISKDIFPDMIHPGSVIGNLHNNVINELNISNITVIAPASHDTASAVAGIPIVDSCKTWSFVSMGTWLIQGIEISEPIVSLEAFKTGFANEGGCENRNLFLKNVNGLWIIQQCMQKWRNDKGQNILWSEIDDVYPLAKPFNALIDVDDSVFIAPSHDMPGIISSYCKNKNQNIPEGIGPIARCFYESLVLKIRFNFEQMEKICGNKIELMRIIGGGTNNKLICQWISNAIGIIVAAGPTETTAVGNLIMQLKVDREIDNVDQGRIICHNSSDIFIYEPKDKLSWDIAYERFLKILE